MLLLLVLAGSHFIGVAAGKFKRRFDGGEVRLSKLRMPQPLSRLGKQLEEAIATFEKIGARFALIGGLALAPHKVVRATQDVDFLIDADLADAVDVELSALGYKCLHRSTDAANYLRGDQRLDFLYAHRPAARQFLQSAREWRISAP